MIHDALDALTRAGWRVVEADAARRIDLVSPAGEAVALTVAPVDGCGSGCDLVSRDSMLGTVGVAQCRNCSTVYQAALWRPRQCSGCGLGFGRSMHDPCVGEAPGVLEACCGHGVVSSAWVSFRDGSATLTGEEAARWLSRI